jgi:hypothetical protein
MIRPHPIKLPRFIFPQTWIDSLPTSSDAIKELFQSYSQAESTRSVGKSPAACETHTSGKLPADISLFALQPLEPSDGCFALRKLMANG